MKKEDCGCNKEEESGNWMGDTEVGDDFLFEESTNMIKSIERNLKYGKVNSNAIFNKKMDEDQLSNLVLDDTVVDYSYIDDDDDTLVNYDYEVKEKEETEGEEETEEPIIEETVEMEDGGDEPKIENFSIINEKEEPIEDTSEYLEKKRVSSRREAEKYLNDLL